MARLRKHETPHYRLHKASGQAIVTLQARDYYLGKHGSEKSKEKYARLVAEWIANSRQAPAAVTRRRDVCSATLIGDVALAFWNHAKTYYRNPDGNPTGEAENFHHALRLLTPYATLRPEEFTPSKLRAVQGAMIVPRTVTNPRTGQPETLRGWCRNNANRQINRIRHVFKWAASQELIPASIHAALQTVEPLKRGRTAARETRLVRPVPQQMVDQVMAELPPAVRLLVQLQGLTGARGGELFKLRGSDIDTTQAVWVFKPRLHKTAYLGHERDIRFGPAAQKLLLPLLQANVGAYLFSPATSEVQRRAKVHRLRLEHGTPISCGNIPGSNKCRIPHKAPGDYYTKDSYARAIAVACDRAFPPPAELERQRVQGNGRKTKSTRWETEREWRARLGTEKWAELVAWRKVHRFRPHQLRHTVATDVRRTHGLEAAQAVLGQRSISSTQIYAEKSAELADRVIAEIG